MNSLNIPDLSASLCSTPAKEEDIEQDQNHVPQGINPFQFSAGKSGFEDTPDQPTTNNYFTPAAEEMSSRMQDLEN